MREVSCSNHEGRTKSKMHKHLKSAARISSKGNNRRSALVGAVGVRKDGTVVYSFNGSVRQDTVAPCPKSHAEARLVRKLDVGSVVYVARTRKDNGKMAMSKPCASCERILRNRGVKRVIYTIAENEFGILEF